MCIYVGIIKPTYFSQSLVEGCYGYRFLLRIGKIWQTQSLFCVLTFHNGPEYRNMDARVNTADDPSTSDENLVNFGTVIPEFCGRVCPTGHCHAFHINQSINQLVSLYGSSKAGLKHAYD